MGTSDWQEAGVATWPCTVSARREAVCRTAPAPGVPVRHCPPCQNCWVL